MRLYFVDPPPFDHEPDGKDDREWFTSLAEARKCFNQWARRIRKWENRMANLNNRGEYEFDCEDNFTCGYLTLGVVDLDVRKKQLCKKLNSGLLAREFLAEYVSHK